MANEPMNKYKMVVVMARAEKEMRQKEREEAFLERNIAVLSLTKAVPKKDQNEEARYTQKAINDRLGELKAQGLVVYGYTETAREKRDRKSKGL
jgi:hypothetical protein